MFLTMALAIDRQYLRTKNKGSQNQHCGLLLYSFLKRRFISKTFNITSIKRVKIHVI